MKYVIYYRVSTKRQGESGLGLDAQKRDVSLFLNNYSEQPYTIVKEFTEIESGTNSEREELRQAIAIAKKQKAVLLVAKLDRLSRKVSFIAKLIEDDKLEFKVASMPNADKFSLHIYAALAEQERDFISKRTKQALAEAKERGVKLGGLRDKTNERNKAKTAKATLEAERLRALVTPMVTQKMSLQAIADSLNQSGVKTPTDGEWHKTSISRLKSRLSL
jgi:DNA invertase Pin-like site-specific DNA recombinase